MKLPFWNTAKLRSFRGNERGQVAIVFAISVLPVLAMIGAGLDFGRAHLAKNDLQIATDVAVISAAQAGATTLAAAQAVASATFAANFKQGTGSIVLSQPDAQTFHGEATATVQTVVMNVAGLTTMTVHAMAEAGAFSAGAIEVALALDNTGSMINDMASLKSAASNLVTSLFTSATGNPNFRMSVVPFVATVNPGRSVLEANNKSMLDLAGQSRWHGDFVKWQWIGMQNQCNPNWGSGGGGGSTGPGSGGTGADLKDYRDPATKFAQQLIGFGPARADVTPNTVQPLSGANGPRGEFVPNGFNVDSYTNSWTGGCDWLTNPGTVSNYELFNRINTQTTNGGTFNGWKGCVEARPTLADGAAKDYDVTDDPPTSSDPNSLFVPYFAISESSQFDTSWVPKYANNWLPDAPGNGNGTYSYDPTGNYNYRTTSKQWTFATDTWERSFSLLKYDGKTKPTIVETAPNTQGPNYACPDAVLPLTNTKQDVLNKISGLSYWNGGGTIISEGLMWAWRTLSPNLPYATGKAYSKDTQKVIVLMTDGTNEIGENGRDQWGNIDWSPFFSMNAAYGYLNGNRFPTRTFAAGVSYLNSRLIAACTNAKAKGIQIYTVLFRQTDPTVTSLLQSCASSPSKAFTAANGADLSKAFGVIGSSVSNLRLKK